MAAVNIHKKIELEEFLKVLDMSPESWKEIVRQQQEFNNILNGTLDSIRLRPVKKEDGD